MNLREHQNVYKRGVDHGRRLIFQCRVFDMSCTKVLAWTSFILLL